jgi:Caspase domain
MTGSGNGAQGRRLLVATAVAHYPKAPQWDRPGLAAARQQMIDLFTGALGYAHVSDLGLDPTETQLTEHLRTLCRHHVRSEDHLVVYIAGHGEVLEGGGGRHVLLTADTDPDDIADALPTLRLADKMLLDTPVQRLLLLLDTCYSGSGGNQVAAAVLAGMEREWTASGSGLVVVTSTQPFEQAETGAFPAVLSAVVQALSTAGQVPASLDLVGVVQAMNSHPGRPAHQRMGWTALGLTGALPDFLPNPRHRPGMTDIDLHLQQAAEWDAQAQRREVEFRRRFLVRAMAAQGPDQAWWFSGRSVALTEITAWLTQPWPQQAQPVPQDLLSPAAQPPGARTLVVTAGPGSGKTAVLGLVSALTHPDHRPTVPVDAIQLPPAAIPPVGAVDVTIYAGGLTHHQVQAGLAAAAQIRADTIGELITALNARTAASGRPFTAIIDALDEAADPAQLITQVLRPITNHAPGVRLLLGTRPHLLKLLQLPGTPARISVIDLDAPRWADRQALTVYTIRNLIEASPDSPYLHAPPLQARPVADAVADAADPSFLVARIISTTLAAADTIADPTDPHWRASLPRLPGDAMRNDLDTRLGSDAARARDLLRPLAYAEGQGLPWEDIWAPLASRISGRAYTNDDLHWLRQHAGSYIVEAAEAGWP